MLDLLLCVIFYIMPGIIPAVIRIRRTKADSYKIIRFAIDVLVYDFIAMTCAYGFCLLIFGKNEFSPCFISFSGGGFSGYLFAYNIYLFTAYLTALLLSLAEGAFCEKAFYRLNRTGMAVYVMAFTALLAFLAVGAGYDAYAGSSIVFSEVCSNNLTNVLDEYGRDSDYIELYNPSLSSVYLDGWFLTEEGKNGNRVSLDGFCLAPKSYLLLYANGESREGKTDSYSIPLRINKSGEELFLFDNNENCVDNVEIPALPVDVVYARIGEHMERWETVRYGTPGAGNEEMTPYVIPSLEKPVFSVKSGFYDDAFVLSLAAAPGETVYYTTDGTIPTKDSPVYQEPIRIEDASGRQNYYSALPGISLARDYMPPYAVDKATVVNAMSVNAQGEVSDIATEVYFVGFGEKEGYNNVEIISVNADPEDLFSSERGIYVLGDAFEEYRASGQEISFSEYIPANYIQRGKTAERSAAVFLFDEDRKLDLQNKAGIRIHGGSTRIYRQKGFNLYERPEYSEQTFGFGKYMLRTSDLFETMLKDVFNQSLVEDRSLAIQRGRPCILFLNGEYWGLYNLQERYSAAYFEDYFGIPKDNLIILKERIEDNDTVTEASTGREEDIALYEELLNYARENDLSIAENYEKISTMMDIQSFIDYYVFEIYIGNTDWPINNYCRFRSRNIKEGSVYEDGRWRWAAYDTDEAIGGETNYYDSNHFAAEAYNHGVAPTETALMSNLLENETFKRRFVTSFLDMVNNNFAYGTVHDKLYEMAEVYAEPMVQSYRRFNEDEYTLDNFWGYIDVIDEFYKKRAEYIVPYLAEAMGLNNTQAEVRLEIAIQTKEGQILTDEGAGVITLNSIVPEMKDGVWTGTYLTDYPVDVSADAADGYRFLGWEGTYVSAEKELKADVPAEGICIRAVFGQAED